jgi:hypothetical protein
MTLSLGAKPRHVVPVRSTLRLANAIDDMRRQIPCRTKSQLTGAVAKAANNCRAARVAMKLA